MKTTITDYFDYLKKKVTREIRKLIKAENCGDEAAADYALNIAFTIYHLFEWCEKMHSNSPRTSYQICKQSGNVCLEMLHDIVIYNKHAEVRSSLTGKSQMPRAESILSNLCTEKNERIVTEEGLPLGVISKVRVYFDDKLAIDVLRGAFEAFEFHEKKLKETNPVDK